MQPKYPYIHVDLTKLNGNAFHIVGEVARKLRQGGVPATKVGAFVEEATSSDYNHLLETCAQWVDVEPE